MIAAILLELGESDAAFDWLERGYTVLPLWRVPTAALSAGIREALEPVWSSDGGSWRMDETYIKVRGSRVNLYRAVDKAGRTVQVAVHNESSKVSLKIL
jgi:hypothetical protein